jgi:RNA polymerase sigma factor (sigma-70 family)
MEPIRTVEHPPPYLRQMTVNLCRSRRRRGKLEQRTNRLLHKSDEGSVPTDDDRLDLWAAVRRLPERQRLCVILRYLEDLPEAQIAAVMDCSVGTVKSQLHRARRRLGELLGTDFEMGDRR